MFTVDSQLYHFMDVLQLLNLCGLDLLQRPPKIRERMGLTAKLLVLSLCLFLCLSMSICVLGGPSETYAFWLSTVSESESCAVHL